MERIDYSKYRFSIARREAAASNYLSGRFAAACEIFPKTRLVKFLGPVAAVTLLFLTTCEQPSVKTLPTKSPFYPPTPSRLSTPTSEPTIRLIDDNGNLISQ